VQVQITVCCPRCRGQNIKRNGKSGNNKQKCLCKDYGRQFVDDHNSTSGPPFPCRQADLEEQPATVVIRDICDITGYSRDKVQAALSTDTPNQRRTHTLSDVANG